MEYSLLFGGGADFGFALCISSYSGGSRLCRLPGSHGTACLVAIICLCVGNELYPIRSRFDGSTYRDIARLCVCRMVSAYRCPTGIGWIVVLVSPATILRVNDPNKASETDRRFGYLGSRGFRWFDRYGA